MCQIDTLESTKKQSTSEELVINSLRGANRKPYDLKVGDTMFGFTLKSIEEVKDFNLVAYTLEHDRTGAKYLHLDTADMENVSRLS